MSSQPQSTPSQSQSQPRLKRKRSRHNHRHRSNLPPETINPHSHPPNLLKQFRAAGLPETELLPSVPDFPHRPLPRDFLWPHGGRDDEEVAYDDDDDDAAGEGGGDTPAAGRRSPGTGGETDDPDAKQRMAAERRLTGVERERRERERNIGVLVAILRRCVDEGDMVRAKRAMGLLVRAKVDGAPVDLRREGFWGLGAEILMRDGERPPRREGDASVGGEGGAGRRRRWGSVQNMVLVRRFLEDLIQLHPYNRLHPESISALDFYPVLFSCEVYNVHVELEMALERVEEEENDEEDESEMQDYDARERRVKAARDELREGALEVMRGVAGRMDELLMTLPYSKSLEMLRLRAMIALFMGDLGLPSPPREEEEEEEEGMDRRDTERERAVGLFKKVLDGGGELEPWIHRLVAQHDREDDDDADESDDEDGPPMALPKFSSLPMR